MKELFSWPIIDVHEFRDGGLAHDFCSHLYSRGVAHLVPSAFRFAVHFFRVHRLVEHAGRCCFIICLQDQHNGYLHLRHSAFTLISSLILKKIFVWIISGIRRFIQDLEKEAQIYERQRFGPGTPVSGSAIFSCFSQLFTSCSFVRGRINLASRQRCWPIIGGWRRGARETVQ